MVVFALAGCCKVDSDCAMGQTCFAGLCRGETTCPTGQVKSSVPIFLSKSVIVVNSGKYVTLGEVPSGGIWRASATGVYKPTNAVDFYCTTTPAGKVDETGRSRYFLEIYETTGSQTATLFLHEDRAPGQGRYIQNTSHDTALITARIMDVNGQPDSRENGLQHGFDVLFEYGILSSQCTEPNPKTEPWSPPRTPATADKATGKCIFTCGDGSIEKSCVVDCSGHVLDNGGFCKAEPESPAVFK